MNYKILFKSISISLIVIALLCVVSILFIQYLPLTSTLKEAVIAEIIGSGILGGIVASVFFYLQELTTHQSNKTKASGFIARLTSDIKESFNRGASAWNLSGNNKFYFDNSIVNSLYDIYDKHSVSITEYQDYLKDNKLIKLLNSIYEKTREGYVIGEKIDNVLYQIVRVHHHKLNVISANDYRMISYLKAKLVANFSDEDVARYLEWQQAPDRANDLLKAATEDSNISSLIKDVMSVRQELLQEIEKLRKILSIKTTS